MAKNSNAYKHPGGVIGFPRCVLRSDAYKSLNSNARALMFELQNVWRPFEPAIHFSVRRAAVNLSVSPNTANRAFNELREHGFISIDKECDWFNGKAREWKLNWLSNNGSEPTNEWMNWVKK